MLILGLVDVHILRMWFHHWALILRLVKIFDGNQFCKLPYTKRIIGGLIIIRSFM